MSVHWGGCGFGHVSRKSNLVNTVFDFSGAALPSGATFTRASIGTRLNAAGAIVTETNDVARWDYDQNGTFLGLLYERSSTNLVTQSGTTSDAAWSIFNAAKTSTNNADPAGGTSAGLFTSSGASSAHAFNCGGAFSVVNTTRYALTIFDKAGTASIEQLTMGDVGFGANGYADYALSGSGSVSANGTGAVAAIQPYPNGWYRPSLIFTAVSSSAICTVAVVFIAGGTDTRLPTNTSAGTLLAWGAQCEAVTAGQSPTSYIPTTTTSVTRAADALVLNWAARGVADGTITCRYTFDDLSTQDVSTTVSSGTSTVPTNLNRPRILRAEKV